MKNWKWLLLLLCVLFVAFVFGWSLRNKQNELEASVAKNAQDNRDLSQKALNYKETLRLAELALANENLKLQREDAYRKDQQKAIEESENRNQIGFI